MKTFKPGEPVRVGLNEKFELHLPVLAAAGYQWELAEQPPGLALVRTSFQTQTGSQVGGTSQQVLRFRSVQPGTHPLRLVCKRAWETDVAETLTVPVSVKP